MIDSSFRNLFSNSKSFCQRIKYYFVDMGSIIIATKVKDQIIIVTDIVFVIDANDSPTTPVNRNK
jgi:hypothetical protein